MSPLLSSGETSDENSGQNQHLRKKIVDLSKTKKRKEFDHDNLITNRFSMLVKLSINSKTQYHQSQKVGKKIIG